MFEETESEQERTIFVEIFFIFISEKEQKKFFCFKFYRDISLKTHTPTRTRKPQRDRI